MRYVKKYKMNILIGKSVIYAHFNFISKVPETDLYRYKNYKIL